MDSYFVRVSRNLAYVRAMICLIREMDSSGFGSLYDVLNRTLAGSFAALLKSFDESQGVV